MAISENDKQNIVEDETLRFETRRRLLAEQGHCCRSLWGWIIAAVLAVALVLSFCHHHFYYGPMGQGFGPRYQMGQLNPDGAPVPPQPKR